MKRLAPLLLISSAIFGESFRPDQVLPDCYPPLFNAPASVEVCNGWDLFAESSFIYWHVSQDYMDAGRSAQFAPGGPVAAPNAHNFYPEFSYQPGFKAGVGIENVFDHWMAYFEYTWLHQDQKHSTGNAPSSVAAGQKIWVPNDWFNTLATLSTAQQAAQINTHWKMHLDQFNLLFELPFYEAPKGVIYHFSGFRSFWIRQTYTIEALLAEDLTSPPVVSHNESRSWSIGPMVGIAGHSIQWWGFRLEGQTKFSLLYTRYTKLHHEENDQGFGTAAAIAGSMAPYSALRPVSEIGFGAGWGSYFYQDRLHIDIAARYDFNILWNQNMMRQTAGSLGDRDVGYANAAGHLYLHGLTLDCCLNF